MGKSLSRDCEDFIDQKGSWGWGTSRSRRATEPKEYSSGSGLSAEIWDQFSGTFCICAYTHLSRACRDTKLQLLGKVSESICQISLGLLQEDEGLMGRVKFHEMSYHLPSRVANVLCVSVCIHRDAHSVIYSVGKIRLFLLKTGQCFPNPCFQSRLRDVAMP